MTTAIIMTGASPEEVWPLIRDFHYSKRMPGNVQTCYALRQEGGLFGDTGPLLAAIVFSIPPTRWSEEVLELSRLVRTPACKTPLSVLISFAIKRLKTRRFNLCVSFADFTQNHIGYVYQAGSWFYGGQRARCMDGLVIAGQFWPGRSLNSTYGTRSPEKLRVKLPQVEIQPHYDEGKFLYWKPIRPSGLTKAKRLGLNKLSYPKHATRLLDELVPFSASQEQTLGVAPPT